MRLGFPFPVSLALAPSPSCPLVLFLPTPVSPSRSLSLSATDILSPPSVFLVHDPPSRAAEREGERESIHSYASVGRQWHGPPHSSYLHSFNATWGPWNVRQPPSLRRAGPTVPLIPARPVLTGTDRFHKSLSRFAENRWARLRARFEFAGDPRRVARGRSWIPGIRGCKWTNSLKRTDGSGGSFDWSLPV